MEIYMGQYVRWDNHGPIYEVLLIEGPDPDDDVDVATVAVVGSDTNEHGEYIDVERIGVESLTPFDSSMGDWLDINKNYIENGLTM